MSRNVIAQVGNAIYYGRVSDRDGDSVTLVNARMIHWWTGASHLFGLAANGTVDPGSCLITSRVPSVTLYGVNQLVEMTDAAMRTLDAVPDIPVQPSITLEQQLARNLQQARSGGSRR